MLSFHLYIMRDGTILKVDIDSGIVWRAEARRHVNRICIASERPLVDGGTTGYLGQVVTIIKGKTACYDCTPKPPPKGFAVCTIRSTPDKPIHCIVWAKHLFNLFFGNKDDENAVTEIDISMTAEDVVRKLFVDDINKLIGMEDLWKSRKPPSILDLDGVLKDTLTDALTDAKPVRGSLPDREVWPVVVQVQLLIRRHRELAERAKAGPLSWDKDDDAAMDFVLCASNLRSNAFAIDMQHSFRCKQMAGLAQDAPNTLSLPSLFPPESSRALPRMLASVFLSFLFGA